MILNFKPNEWNEEKIIEYVIGDRPLDDQQISFLNYFKELQQENEEYIKTSLTKEQFKNNCYRIGD